MRERTNYKDSPQFQAMLRPAEERLKKYTPEDICRRSGIRFDEETQMFLVDSMNQTIHVHYPDFVITESLEMWHHLTILQYMDTADGTPLTGRKIALTQMRGGISRGQGYDRDLETMFAHDFAQVSAEDFREACLRLGAKILPGKGDVTAEIPYAPRFPVTINFWEADDEFPASGKALVDAAAEHYLTIEAAGGACSAVVAQIKFAQGTVL